MQNTKQKSGTKQKLTIAAIFGAMGPGLLAALSGNDAGGIATYSSAGASYGYKMLWMLPVMTVLLIVTQETAARCGCVTGKGLASLIRERFGVRKSVLAMAALLIANTAVTISEFAGIASGLALFGVPASISVPLVALLVWMLTMSGSFQRIEKILLLVSCVFVTYIVAAFMAGPNWGEVAVDLVVPNIQNDPSYVSLVVATIGTTIAPWMIFLAQNNVVDKNAGEDDIVLQRIDRLSQAAELMPAERAEAVLVLFVAVGCSADVRSSVNYAIDYAHATCGGGTSTPRSLGMSMTAGEREPAPAHPLGLLRVQNSFVVSAPRWIQPSEQGVEIGALATGEGDITDVGDDVSARHAHIWCDAQNIWHVEDLSSTNGTVVVNGATRVCIQVEPGRSAQLNPGDELKLGESTTYAILFGAL